MKTITDNTCKKAEIKDKSSANEPVKDKFCGANDPLGLERFLVIERHHDLVASLTGYYTVVARMIEETDPAKAAEFRKRSSEVFQSRRADIWKSYSELEIISDALAKEYRELSAFADEWEATHKRAKEVFKGRDADTHKSYPEREIISDALAKKYRELAAFADEC